MPNLLLWMKHTMPFLMRLKEKIMTISSSEKWCQFELIASSTISSGTDSWVGEVMMMISDPFSITNGLKIWTESWWIRLMRRTSKTDKLLRLLLFGLTKMARNQRKQWPPKRLSRTARLTLRQLKIIFSPMARETSWKLSMMMVRSSPRNTLWKRESSFPRS